MRELNILVCGVGGQGNLLVERVIGKSAMKEGYFVIGEDTFGAAQRGGSVLSHIRIGSDVSSGLVPEGRCHVVLGLEPKEALETAAKFLCKDGLVIVNMIPVFPARVRAGQGVYPDVEVILGLLRELTPNVIQVNANAMARKTAATERAMNMVMTGILIGMGVIPISPGSVKSEIEQASGRFAVANCAAFDIGFEYGEARKISGPLGIR